PISLQVFPLHLATLGQPSGLPEGSAEVTPLTRQSDRRQMKSAVHRRADEALTGTSAAEPRTAHGNYSETNYLGGSRSREQAGNACRHYRTARQSGCRPQGSDGIPPR